MSHHEHESTHGHTTHGHRHDSHGDDHNHGDAHDHTASSSCGHAADTSGLSAEAVAECPVMPGSPVIKADAESAGLFRDYDGNRYWFCCDACGPLFDADPQRYAVAA